MNLVQQSFRKLSLSVPFKCIKVNPAFRQLEPLINQLPDQFFSSGETIYKGRNEIKVLSTEAGKIVIKSFGKIYIANRFIYAWVRNSKAQRSFENAGQLLNRGIDTPVPVAYVNCYRKGLIEENMFIYQYCPSSHDMVEPLRNKSFPDRKKLLQDFTYYTFSLNTKHIFHKDYSWGNILFEKRESQYHFTLVDINRIRFCKIGRRKKYKVFSRLPTDKEALHIIAGTYANLYHEDEEYVARKIIQHNDHFFHKKGRKKRLKKFLHLG